MARLSVRGLLFVLALVATAMVGCFAYTPTALLLAAPTIIVAAQMTSRPAVASPPPRVERYAACEIPYQLFVQWSNFFAFTWFSLVGLLLEGLLRIQISYVFPNEQSTPIDQFFEAPPPGKFNIVIMNHRTRIDWMFAWALFARTPALLRTLKIVLKAPLMKAPIFGWTMQCFRFIFLQRNRSLDDAHIDNMIQLQKQHREGITLLIFPEGTDLSESNVAKSQAFAAKNGLPRFYKVLNPRTTGLVQLKHSIGVENVHAVYDITMGYTDFALGERPSEACLLDGRVPRRLHFMATRHTFATCSSSSSGAASDSVISPDDAGFARWIESRFELKELALSRFYAQSPVDFDPPGRQVVSPPASGPLLSKVRAVSVWTYGIYPLVMWLIPTLTMLHALLWRFSLPAWLYVVAVSAAYVALSNRGGVDALLLRNVRLSQRQSGESVAASKSK